MRALVVIAALSAAACGKKTAAIAELAKADGPVDKQSGDPTWAPAPVGTEFFVGDAARTADAGATLQIVNGTTIAMQPKTIVRFGGKSGSTKMVVEAGTIDLSGDGTFELDIGDVKLGKNGTVRVTSKGTFELAIGDAQVSTASGKTVDLQVGKVLDVADVSVTANIPDAAVADAAVAVADAVPPDAPAPVGDVVASVPAGKKAEIQAPGEKTWKPLADGTPLPKGTKVRGTASLALGPITLELTGNARATVDDRLALEVGIARARSSGDGSIGLPGGALQLRGSDKVPGEATLDTSGASTTVGIARGAGKLVGKGDSELAMNRGESARLAPSGKITPLEAIPPYFDFRVPVGETFTVHDPKGAVAIQFQFGGKCPDGGIVEIDRDSRFRTSKISAGKDAANHFVRSGTYAYRLRCTAGAGEGTAVASGFVAVVTDGGTRALPKLPPVNPFDVDGRPWRFSYQSVIPDLAVTFPGGGSSFRLHLARGGKEQTFDASSSKMRLPGSALSEGTYNYWFDRDGVRVDKVNTLTIEFDQMSAQVYIELPVNGKPWPAGDVEVKGAVLSGWNAAVETVTIPIDKARRFHATVQPPPGQALAIRLSHLLRGIHYYTRRPK